MQCFMTKDAKSLIDVDNVYTTYFDTCAFFATLASFLLQFCPIHLSLASLAFYAAYCTFLSVVFIVLSCWHYPYQHFDYGYK